MTDIQTRNLKISDSDAIVSLLIELGNVTSSLDNFDKDSVNHIFKEMNRFPEIYYNIIAEIDNTIVGFISLILYKIPFHKGGTVLINELIVNKDHQGKGIGKLLINKVKEIAKANKMNELVGTQKENLDAQKFYRKCGFSN